MSVSSAPVPLREQKRELSRRAIVEAAGALLGQKGYADMSMDDVAERAGISKATLYQYFRSKDALCVQVVVRDMEYIGAFAAALDPSESAVDRLRDVLREGLQRRHAYATASVPAMLPASVWANPQFKVQRDRTMAANNALLNAAIAEGSINPNLAPPVVTAMIGAIFAVDLEALMRELKLPSDGAAEAVLDALFDGIGTGRAKRGKVTRARGQRK